MGKIINLEHPKSKKSSHRKKIIVFVISLAVVILGGGATYIYKEYILDPNSSINNDKTKGVTLIERATMVAASGDYSGAQKLLDDEIDTNTTNIKLADLYAEKAVLAQNNQNYKDSIDFAMQAEALYPSRFTSRLIAQIASMNDNKDLAIEYYQKTISRYSEEEKTSEIYEQDYTDDVIALEKLING